MLKDMKAKLKNRQGFSLVELIVVIAIMVILVAMLLPSVAGLINSATSANGAQAAASLYTAATTAATSNASMPNLDATKRLNNLQTGSGNLSVSGNIDASESDQQNMYVFMDDKAMNVIAVYYHASDGKYYVNPTYIATKATSNKNTDEQDKAKGIFENEPKDTDIKEATGKTVQAKAFQVKAGTTK